MSEVQPNPISWRAAWVRVANYAQSERDRRSMPPVYYYFSTKTDAVAERDRLRARYGDGVVVTVTPVWPPAVAK